jgi:DUF1009 family protein
MKKLIILAGKGELPFIFKHLAEKKGYQTYTVGVRTITERKTDFTIPFLGFLEFEQLLKELGKPPIVMLGKFDPKIPLILGGKLLFFLNRFFYGRNFKKNYEVFLNLKGKIKIFTPSEIIKTYISYMEKRGFNFLPSKEIKNIGLPLLAQNGLLTPSIKITPSLIEEGKRFITYAKSIADMDIGQTLVFKDGHIIAVEGLEGTDKTIERACKLAGKGFSVIKVGRTHQDFRIDVPTVGLNTLKLLSKCKVKALFLEAGNVFIVPKEEFLKKANRLGIAIIGLTHY